MIKMTFYPLGNADTCLIELENGRKMLVDYAHSSEAEREAEPKVDLAKELRESLDKDGCEELDVVVITHADNDHVRGAADFFYLDHAATYQDGDRIKIKELWVPAAVILEEGLDDDARIIRQEARHRLKQGSGVRVFSRPELLKDWLAEEGLSVESRASLITDAGQVVPGFTKSSDGAEFFVHSPFAHRDGEELQERNSGSIFMHATFSVGGVETKALLGADTPHEVLAEIVQITRARNREERLTWDIFKLPHHCSYLSLSSEKGESKTVPAPDVAWLFGQARNRAVIVSPSLPVPTEDTVQPPHMQAAAYYKERASAVDGEFIVTMAHPSVREPRPLVIEVDGSGQRVRKHILAAASAIVARPAPRAG